MNASKPLLFVIAAAIAGSFLLAAIWYRSGEGDAPASIAASAEQLVRPHSMSLGPANAAVTIVEFFDPECESCRAMYPIVKQVLAEFDGQVRLVIRYMPLHGNSVYAASLLEAARAQNKYWEYLEVMMLRQPEWASHAAPRPDLLLTYAPAAGLDAEQLRIATTDPDIKARIEQDQADGQALGATRTPTFFVNGKVLGQLGYQPLRAAVQAELQ